MNALDKITTIHKLMCVSKYQIVEVELAKTAYMLVAAYATKESPNMVDVSFIRERISCRTLRCTGASTANLQRNCKFMAKQLTCQ
mmetsp:Transcript_12589/g.16289  ORF Transcript_12589/g.16289 Transcript_12589/m.16289 type:complete len:85 (-) Transcript_12589:230-484(-)